MSHYSKMREVPLTMWAIFSNGYSVITFLTSLS